MAESSDEFCDDNPPSPTNHSQCLININAGDLTFSLNYCGMEFQKDAFFSGGDAVRAAANLGSEEFPALYRTARIGNFSYEFPSLKPGNYLVALHLAEILNPGRRIFDVYFQEQKILSGIDIYAKVGANRPLFLSDLRASVLGEEGLTIRFAGVEGKPLVCGISIARDIFTDQTILAAEKIEIHEGNSSQVGDYINLLQEHMLLKEKLEKIKRDLEDATAEKQVKNKECQDAWIMVRELQRELMRKSMHVGSLAVAVEGQVEEKTRWRQALKEVDEKFELLKLEHGKLSSSASDYMKFAVDMSSITSAIQSASEEFAELREKFVKESRDRKELYNKVLEQKGNIRVFCRCRPLSQEEELARVSTAVDFDFSKEPELAVRAPGSQRKLFKFDCVFGPHADQEMVFEKTAPLATSVMDGYNACIFAYGQTGTGKTFTMEGTREARGVNYRILEKLFDIMKERHGLIEYEISISVMEVYNEQIRDLLLSGDTAKRLGRVEVKQVSGLQEIRVSDMEEAWGVLQTGANARAVGATNCNERSSRSHCINRVTVRGKNLISSECTRSKMWLIDLAGSERVAKTDAQGDRLREAQSINKSLSALGDVIFALACKSAHVPFRNSKLTHLLQDSLGGESKTLMFVQISPRESDASETLCSLNFASRVRGIELGPSKRQLDTTGEASKNKHMLEKIKLEIKGKDDQIKKMDEAALSLELEVKSKNVAIRNLRDRVKELESQLLIERKLARQHVDNTMTKNHHEQFQAYMERAPLVQIPIPSANSITPSVGSNTSPTRIISPQKENNPGSSQGKRVNIKSLFRRSMQKRVVIRSTKARESVARRARAAEMERQRLHKERERQWGIAAKCRVEASRPN